MDLDRIVVANADPQAAKRIPQMREYAQELWAYARANGTPLTLASVQPDQDRIVLTVKDEIAKRQLLDAFSADAAYRMGKDLAGNRRAYRREGPNRRYEIGVATPQGVSAA